MSAPLRIRLPARMAAGNSDGLKPYLDRLLKLIPAEVLSLYLVGVGVIPKPAIFVSFFWAAFCLVAVGVVKAYGTSDSVNDVSADWTHVTLSMTAFVIWIYSIGGPFQTLGWHQPYIGSLLILGFTFFVPYLYRGKPDTKCSSS